MGWLRRNRAEQAEASPQGETSPPVRPAPPAPTEPAPSAPTEPPGPVPAAEPVQAPTAAEHVPYGPRVRVTAFEQAPDELTWQLPVLGELYRVIPGPDRPDYSLMLLEKPLLFYPAPGFDVGRLGAERFTEDRQGRRMVQVHALVLCARFVGQQLHPGMVDLPVNIAYVIDQSLARDGSLDLAKIEYAAIGFLSEGVGRGPAPTPAEPVGAAAQQPGVAEAAGGPPDRPAPAEPAGEPLGQEVTDRSAEETEGLVAGVAREVAQLLRQGVADRRGVDVHQLQATVAIDTAHRISGLTGNADGTAPEPTPATFDRINAALGRLAGLPADRMVSSLSLRVAGSDVTVEARPRVPE